jgi:hypothetical protein
MKTLRLQLIVLACLACATHLHAQTISYILPDIGSPGMNTYVEIVAPTGETGSFGTDGIYVNNPGDRVRVICDNPADTALVAIGPVVVSWNGRLAATQIFVRPGIDPGTTDWQTVDSAYIVPIRVVVNGVRSNREFFYILRPQPAIIAGGGGTLGTGALGRRSRRGAMIVDSLVLGSGTFAVTSDDIDPVTPGNQGTLPFVLISRGRITGQPGTTLNVSATGKDGGPGGGGGGGNFCDAGGSGSDGGRGYTGGGRGGRNGSSFTSNEFRNPGSGSGPFIGPTGGSLNGVAGATAPWYEAAGGGTGHPFGTSGEGCNDGTNCAPAGGYGGGSGAQQTLGGGGGGNATPGQPSIINGVSAGQVVGNRQLVPLAGGSGGAGGNPQGAFVCSGEGGGGGGAIRISAPEILNVVLTANGGDGQERSNGPGGSGSGGAVSVEAKMQFATAQLSAAGGTGGIDGGAGRLRIDGPRATITLAPSTASTFRGPSTDTASLVARTFTLTGTGSGDDILLFLKSASMPWTPIDTVNTIGNFWSAQITLPQPDDLYYLVAMQKPATVPGGGTYTAEPHAVLSQAAANVLRILTVPLISAPTARSYRLVCEDALLDTITVGNSGEAPLWLQQPSFANGSRGFSLVSPTGFPQQVAPGASVSFVVRYAATPGVTGIARDTLVVANNDTSATWNPWRLALEARKDSTSFSVAASRIDLGMVYFCGTSGIDTVLDFRNTGTVPLALALPSLAGTGFSLVSPSAGAFPLTVPAGASVPLVLRFEPAQRGVPVSATLEILTSAEGCERTLDVELTGTAHDVAIEWTDAVAFAALRCAGERRDTTLLVRNTGTAPVTISAVAVADPQFSLVAPSLPLVIPAGGTQPLTVRYAPATAGVHASRFTLRMQPCDRDLVLDLGGRRDSVGLSGVALDFGVLRQSQFPVQRTMTVRNTGSVAIDVSQALLAYGTHFDIVSFVPAVLQPGDSLVLTLRFRDPGVDGTVDDRVMLTHAPSCDYVEIVVRGARVDGAAVLVIDTVRAAPGEQVRIGMHLYARVSPLSYGVTMLRVHLRFNRRLLLPDPRFVPAVNIREVGEDRLMRWDAAILNTEPGQDYFFPTVLPFIAMLGPVDRTAITVDSVEVVGGLLDLEVHDGLFLLDICREGGDRLFDGSQTAGFRSVHPNPFNPVTVIEYGVIEQAQARVVIVDMLGREVAVLADGVQEPGVYTVRFDASALPTGVYTAVLATPSAVYHHRIILTR